MFRKLLLLVVFILAPPLLTALFYVGTLYLLAATSRTIDAQTLTAITLGEAALFYFGAFLELRSRWSLQTDEA